MVPWKRDERTPIAFERRGAGTITPLEILSSEFVKAARLADPLPGFIPVFASKQSNSTGLPLADLTARPIGGHFLRPNQPNKAYDAIRTKLRQDHKGSEKGWGVKWFPA